MKDAQIIVLATPVFLALIAVELLVGLARGRNTYRLHDAMASIGLGMLSQVVALFTKLLNIGLYTAVFASVAWVQLPATSVWVWVAALLLYDLLYYWKHRFGHRMAIGWAAHVVHHQSEDYNLSTALRQTSTGWLADWLFYLPMAVLGFPPLVFAVVALVDLLYQYWVHTQQIGKLGWFDRWFCSPSNHRVHHAVNDAYVDKNYGGILVLWDRLFGSFTEERDGEPCVYGTRSPLRSFNPLWANLEVYAALARDAWFAGRWADKLRVCFKPPGWRPADVAARFPKPAFDIHQVRRFDPPTGPLEQAAALVVFAGVLAATVLLLWNAHTLSLMAVLLGAAGIVAALSVLGWLGAGRGRARRASVAERAAAG
ncbi:sterol desaturase family protein [Aquabacterium sp.]|uniref:sterol desaturase family protein n=1 Tax=Aquabacterium sp. TaxID=1872578 RepID=UPI002B6EAB68|nr:sterol desaturase family protein [Aquabacterium sp.]HSW07797.1 sterol desaturase family protein [Aquabacterium sp.]